MRPCHIQRVASFSARRPAPSLCALGGCASPQPLERRVSTRCLINLASLLAAAAAAATEDAAREAFKTVIRAGFP